MIRKIKQAIWWLRYRTTHRYHVVKCDGLKPGYYEAEDRMLHSMFGLLREHVEEDCGSSAEEGLAHLDWAAGLKYEDYMVGDDKSLVGTPTHQAIAAKEVKDLYIWWTVTRPNRIPSDVASGSFEAHQKLDQSGYQWFTPCEDNPRLSQWAKDISDPLYQDWSAKAKIDHDIEEGYHAEDEAMMKRLVAVRRSMWT